MYLNGLDCGLLDWPRVGLGVVSASKSSCSSHVLPLTTWRLSVNLVCGLQIRRDVRVLNGLGDVLRVFLGVGSFLLVPGDHVGVEMASFSP